MTIQLDERQLLAVAQCCDRNRRVVAITGEAGSGKTTIMREAYRRLADDAYNVALAAPTGKAARRITEATGIAAVTLHKLLKYSRPEVDIETGESKGATVPAHDKRNPMGYDVVIIDEYAMVNEELHRNLLDALKSGARLCAFGDTNQLPPIEQYALQRTDTPFERLLKLPGSVTLDKVYRQAQESPILMNAHRIRKGAMISRKPNFELVLTNNQVEELVKTLEKYRAQGIDFRKLEHQIITVAQKTWTGARALNTALQAVYIDTNDPELDSVRLPRHKWEEKESIHLHVGEKVLCTENTYDLRDYNDRYTFIDPQRGSGLDSDYIECPPTHQMLNGETGVVTAIHGDESFEVDFGDRVVLVPRSYTEVIDVKGQGKVMFRVDPRKRIDLAYAITCHKAQGSEFESVIYVMSKSMWYLQNRNNFYTGVTRARERFTYVGDIESVQDCLRMDSRTKAEVVERYRKQNAALRPEKNETAKDTTVQRSSRKR